MIEVIYNPVAGPATTGRIERIRACLAAKGFEFRILRTKGLGDAVLMAREAAASGAEAVVAVGGDGTIHEVANGLAGTETPLLIVPGGTGNVFARELDLPDSAGGCLSLLTEGRTIAVPLGMANDRYFVLLGSAGFDAEVLERMNHRQKNFLGIAAYVLAGIFHFFRRQPPLWLDFPDRERIEAQAAIIVRGKKYGGNITIAPEGNIEGKTFQAVLLLRKGKLSMAKFALDLLLGRHTRSRHVMIREATSVMIRSSIPSAAQVDGEYLGPLPVRFAMSDVLLRIIVPREFQAG
jgi:YegS/Rv2252/BmrU family lipid kinase